PSAGMRGTPAGCASRRARRPRTGLSRSRYSTSWRSPPPTPAEPRRPRDGGRTPPSHRRILRAPAPQRTPSPTPPMDYVQVDIIGLSTSPSSGGAYALVLGEVDGNRRLPIIIGAFEAQAIALELEKIQPP